MKLTYFHLNCSYLLAFALGTWAPSASGQTEVDLRTQSKSVDFSGASATKPFRTGASLPATCGVGELFFLLGASAGKNTYGCTAANTWTLQSGSTGNAVPDPTNKVNQILTNNGTTASWSAIGGDLTGTPQALTVGGLQGRPVSVNPPADGQVLRWNNAAHDWEPGAVTPVVNYSKSFSSTALVTILGSNHNLGTSNLIVSCYDNSTPAILLQPSSVTVDTASFNISVTFPAAHTGQCIVNGSGSSGLAPTTGGDIAGLASNATVTRLQNRPVSSSAPSDGQVLAWSQNTGQWQPQLSMGSSGGGVSFNALTVSYTNPATLTLGTACTGSSPCNMRFGSTVFSVTSSATATLQSGAGTAYVYITSSGVVTVGSNLAITCSSGCVAVSGISAFPSNSIPLFTWQAIPGGWDPNGGTDQRSYLSTKLLAPGPGLVVLDTGIQSTISVDSATIPSYLYGSASLTFGAIAANSCAPEMTISIPGANPGDPVAPGWPASTPLGVIGIMRVSSGDTVSVRLCNVISTPASVPVGVFQAAIVRSL